jgi:hypothetical protein
MKSEEKSTPRKPAAAWLGLALLLGGAPAWAGPVVTTALAFESEGIDLDSGTVVETDWLAVDEAGTDLWFGYHADRTPHAVAMINVPAGVEIAYLEQPAFDAVTWSDVPSLAFALEAIDQPFAASHTLVVRTDAGAIFKIGNALESESVVVFDYQELTEQTAALPAEPGAASARLARQAPRAPGLAQSATAPPVAPPAGLSPDDWASIEALLRDSRYRFTRREPGAAAAAGVAYGVRNSAHRLRATFAASRVAIEHRPPAGKPWTWEMALTGYGYEGAIQPAVAEAIVADGNRLEIRRGALVEGYVNDERGLEQGFTIAAPPEGGGEGPLAVHLEVGGDLQATPSADGSGLLLADASGQTLLRYGGLAAWDAEGRELPVKMAMRQGDVALEVLGDGASYPVTVDPLVTEVAKLHASDAGPSQYLGYSVAVSGDAIVAAAVRDDINGSGSGSAYVFIRSGSAWIEQAKLVPADGASGDQFGQSVAISGDTIIVGVPGDDDNGPDAGSAYVFTRSGAVWSETAKLLAGDGRYWDEFGADVALSEDTAVVGAAWQDHGDGPHEDFGAAYVFRRSGSGWYQEAKLVAGDKDPGDHFGVRVAVSGDTAVVGAHRDDDTGNNSGSAYVFTRSGAAWSETAKLLASDGGTNDGFGVVGIDGDTVVVGARGDDDLSLNSGAAYVFRNSGAGWVEEAKLLPSDVRGFFGRSVAVSGDRVVVGSWEVGHVFEWTSAGWVERATLLPSDEPTLPPNFSQSVGLSGNTVVAGHHSDYDLGAAAGAVYVFALGSLNQPPVALCRDMTVAADAACLAEASIDDGSYDPDGDPVTLAQDPPGPYGRGANLVTLTAEDGKGGSASCQATVTVVDETPPAVTCPGGIELTADATCQAQVPDLVALASADDACATPVELTLVQDPVLGTTLGLGSHPVTVSATDPSGNTGTCSTLLTVPLHFDGYLPPVGGADDTGGGFGDPVRTFKAGSTIPLKFAVDCAGVPYTQGSHTLEAIQWSTETGAEPPIDASPQDAATTGNAFRLSGEEWHFNLDTAATGVTPGQWEMVCTLSDGLQHRVWIQVK